MADKIDRELGNEIRRIAGTGRKTSYPVMSGKVVSVDEGAGTCVVALTVNGPDSKTKGVTLNAVSGNSNGMILIPADDSQVWVAEIDGPGKWGIVKCSNLKKVLITGNVEVVMNGGDNGGVPKMPKLKTELDKNNALLSHIIAIINGPPITEPGSGAPSALQIALQGAIATDTLGDFSNLENDKVKH